MSKPLTSTDEGLRRQEMLVSVTKEGLKLEESENEKKATEELKVCVESEATASLIVHQPRSDCLDFRLKLEKVILYLCIQFSLSLRPLFLLAFLFRYWIKHFPRNTGSHDARYYAPTTIEAQYTGPL